MSQAFLGAHGVRPGWAPAAAGFWAAVGEGVPQNTEEDE